MSADPILIVDDDSAIRDVLRMALEDAGMPVLEAAGGVQALQLFERSPVALVVLDIGMPGMDGFETCRKLRERSAVPVLFLTARADEIDRVLAFELGGDDHVAKPFSPRELILRIRAILKRGTPAGEERLVHADLEMIPERHRCTLGGAVMMLTATEFGVLAALLRHPAHIKSRNQLIDAVYGRNNTLSGRTIDSHLRNIRHKAQALGYDDVVETVHGVGIRLGSCVA